MRLLDALKRVPFNGKLVPPEGPYVLVSDLMKLAQVGVAEAAQPSCVMGVYCRKHGFIHGGEAEELRERIESLRDGTRGKFHRQQLQALLHDVDARDSVTWLEQKPKED